MKQINYYFLKTFKILELLFWKLVANFYFSSLNNDFKAIIKSNRRYLNNTSSFISSEEYEENDYGIPGNIFQNINIEINNKPTYSDLILLLIKTFNKESINYLEIGVSVMKNFNQINNQLNYSTLVAYDINNILKSSAIKFEKVSKSNNFYKSKNTENNVYYFKGDVLDKNNTSEFSDILDIKYDFVMSDAMHTKNGILSEFENIINTNLNDEFILYYDDLDFPELESAALENFNILNKNYENLNFYTFWISGWVGQNEKMHKNGFITNLDIEDYFKIKKVKLPFFKKIN